MLMHSGNEKQLFTNMTVNAFVPIDPNLLNPSFKVNDVLDDEPEKLERLQYFVSNSLPNFLFSQFGESKLSTFI
jgi:hypothetical protein